MSLDLYKTNGSSPPTVRRKKSLIIKRHGELIGPLLFYRGTERLWFSEKEWTCFRETPTGVVALDGVTNTLKVVDKSSALTPRGGNRIPLSPPAFFPCSVTYCSSI